jgi:hypothetical protein
MPQNLIENGNFEADWAEDRSHRCWVCSEGTAPQEQDVGNIFTPSGWVTWFHHQAGTWDQPEVRDAWKQNDPRRVRSGRKGMLLFTFSRKHDAGFLQQVSVAPGAQLHLSAWAHAWSNHKDKSHPERFPHPDDGEWSEGPGYEAGFCLEGEAPDDNWRNFTFYVGIDPTGGINPLADTVVWGRGAHIYNEYAQIPAVEATAQAATVTVFLRSKTLWPFKHNDAYWDDAELVVVGDEGAETPEVELGRWPTNPKVGETVTIGARCQTELSDVSLLIRQPSGATLSHIPAAVGSQGDWYTWSFTTAPLGEVGAHNLLFSAAGGVEVTGSFEGEPVDQPRRGTPRDQYDRTYVLLPPEADTPWALAAVDAVWDDRRYTIGSSADDAGIGDLDLRRVIAVNPGSWPADLRSFFEEHYPEVEYVPVEAATPDELEQRLKQL